MVSPQSKVLVAVLTSGHVRQAQFYDYLYTLIKPDNSVQLLCHNASPARGRNQIIEAAQSNNCTHILFIDDDMAFKPNSLIALLEHDLDIVSGLYVSRNHPHLPLAFDLADNIGACLPIYMVDDGVRLKPIKAAGMGFLLVKIHVFDKLEKPYVRLGELNPEEWCDDIGFFKRVISAGYQPYVDMEVCIGHIGQFVIWPNKVDGQWYSGYDTNGPTLVNVPYFPEAGYEFKDK